MNENYSASNTGATKRIFRTKVFFVWKTRKLRINKIKCTPLRISANSNWKWKNHVITVKHFLIEMSLQYMRLYIQKMFSKTISKI